MESSPQFGGTFGTLLTGYLVQTDRTTYPPDSEDTPLESQKARPKVPPALLRKGEKTQPLWLYQFLRDPTPIRPQVILRMPKFNMSEEDAVLALVNYFSAADKLANPGMGLHYPYYSVKEREEAYLDDATARYLKRLETDKAIDGRLKGLLPVWEYPGQGAHHRAASPHEGRRGYDQGGQGLRGEGERPGHEDGLRRAAQGSGARPGRDPGRVEDDERGSEGQQVPAAEQSMEAVGGVHERRLPPGDEQGYLREMPSGWWYPDG